MPACQKKHHRQRVKKDIPREPGRDACLHNVPSKQALEAWTGHCVTGGSECLVSTHHGFETGASAATVTQIFRTLFFARKLAAAGSLGHLDSLSCWIAPQVQIRYMERLMTMSFAAESALGDGVSLSHGHRC